jgi:hypothetical protein
MDNYNVIAAYEALSYNEVLTIPNLHILFYRRIKDSVCVAYCLDFDLYGYSYESADESAVEDSFNSLWESVVQFIWGNLTRGTPENIFSNYRYDQLSGSFGDFAKANNEVRLNNLTQSYNNLLEQVQTDPVSLLSNIREQFKDIKDQEEYPEIKKLLNDLFMLLQKLEYMNDKDYKIKNQSEEIRKLQKENSELEKENEELQKTIQNLFRLRQPRLEKQSLVHANAIVAQNQYRNR